MIQDTMMILIEKYQNTCYLLCNSASPISCPLSLYSLLYGHWIFLGDQVLSLSPWSHCSITSIRGPITFPAASSTKIDAFALNWWLWKMAVCRVALSVEYAGRFGNQLRSHVAELTGRANQSLLECIMGGVLLNYYSTLLWHCLLLFLIVDY